MCRATKELGDAGMGFLPVMRLPILSVCVPQIPCPDPGRCQEQPSLLTPVVPDRIGWRRGSRRGSRLRALERRPLVATPFTRRGTGFV